MTRSRKIAIGTILIGLALATATVAWDFFRTKTFVRSSSPLREPMVRMWQSGGWSRSPIRQEIEELVLAEIAVGDPRTNVETHIKRHFRTSRFVEQQPMMPPYDPYYSIIAMHNQDLVDLSEIRIRYWFRSNQFLRVEVDAYAAAL